MHPEACRDRGVSMMALEGVSRVLLFLLLVAPPRWAPAAGAPAQLQSVGRWPASVLGTPLALALAESHAYVGFGAAGMWVVDVRDPQHPQPVAESPIPARQLAVAGGRGVAVGQGRLTVLDLTTATQPEARGTLSIPEPAGTGPVPGCAISGDHAFVTAGPDGTIWAVDLRDPDAPRQVGTYATPGAAHGWTLRGTRLYVADGDAGLQILDVSDPAHPTRLGGLDTPGVALGVDVAGDLAVVADFSAGLKVIDVRDPAHCVVVGTFGGNPTAIESFTHVQSVVVHQTHAYVVDSMSFGLLIIDLANPTQPFLSGRMAVAPGTFPPYPMVISGTGSVAASSQEGLMLLDLADPKAPRRLSTLPTRNDLTAIAAVSHRAYVGDNLSGLHILDLTTPAAPERTGRVATGAFPEQVVGLPDAALLVENTNGFRRVTFIDARTASEPRWGGVYHPSNLFAQHLRVAAAKELAFIAEGWDGPDPISDPDGTAGALQILDISDPSRPMLQGRVTWTNWMHDVACLERTVYLLKDPGYWERGAGIYELVTVDATRSDQPAIVGSLSVSNYPSRMLVSGTNLHVAQFDGNQVFGLADPRHPVRLGSIHTGGQALHDMAVAGHRVYREEIAIAGDGQTIERLVVLDASDPFYPRIVATQTLPYRQSIAAMDSHLFLAEPTYLQVWEWVEPRSRFVEQRLEGGRLHLRWTVPDGTTTRLEHTRSLSPSLWEPVPATQGLLGTNLPALDAAGYFRLVTP